MELWTEYEGLTVAGEYTLSKLRRSEGRNGFFSTADAAGKPAVIRLTEAHYDEDDQLNRWRRVADVKQPFLIGIEKVGRTEVEGVALTYALMEADDAVLASVLAERPLTVPETLQVAISVSSALAALHARNLVHEHVNADNVLAVGETVKLRSDCVRECVEDGEFCSAEQVAATRAKDLHDFGVLLLRCLTLETELKPGPRLPDPFTRIVPAALEGSTTFERIANTLAPPPPSPVVAPAPSPAATAPTAPGTASTGAASASVAAAATTSRATALPRTAQPIASQPIQQSLPLSPTVPPHRQHEREDESDEASPAGLLPFQLPRNWAAWSAGALVLLFLVWHFAGGKKSPTPPAAASIGSSAQPAQVVVRQTNQPTVRATAQPTSASVQAANAASGPGWHVIAYTFYRQDQAQSRANAIAARHPNLNPQVYTPTGHAPFLVALGGTLDAASARQLVRTARREGLPRDTFARNYRQ